MKTQLRVAEVSLSDRLRFETRAAHDAIERAVDLYGRCATLDGYADLLTRLHGFHRVFEQSAPALIADPVFFEPRRKLLLLDQDLDYLGVSAPATGAQAIGPKSWLRTSEDAFGAMYVLEGSTLGGRVIGRFLAERHGLGPGRGATYHDSYGARTGAMWRAFKAYLNGRTLDGDGVVQGARATFHHLQTWLLEFGGEP